MHLSRLGFAVVAPTLSLLLGAAAVTVMFRLINQGSGRFAASATVLLTCTYMAAPAMQIAYTESLALLLICTALLLLRNHPYDGDQPRSAAETDAKAAPWRCPLTFRAPRVRCPMKYRTFSGPSVKATAEGSNRTRSKFSISRQVITMSSPIASGQPRTHRTSVVR
jgi:hypothetical protein